ncbi:hypothetical protein HBI56_086420 [Parastagonospora nodorum]|uniref:Secreted protein n=1 Tax=Phaeosphaeria nodorum (strain SN15 / ATCC MYA-4574 / FGSC 10173) TaxID=321614 RepID=A0A7U2I832_PHANO|nr:hypothetical protein HBH54_239290 [Parastagonospora nodorum]QRD03558.1 hypothetical protein JI435_306980 [Parastagonospora nodorum SN15]KAH3950914.1 hypothetical protein HBH53_068840 [Parastagonospora nodorum]KAH3962947.1 hypothetical protein HBH51_169510 [Parastagonospora nodorum]KAH3979414.1 hypothetical protein HBH52_097390 [Parastagonospora nodorum]
MSSSSCCGLRACCCLFLSLLDVVMRIHLRPSVGRLTPHFSATSLSVYRSSGLRESKSAIASLIGAMVVERRSKRRKSKFGICRLCVAHWLVHRSWHHE